MPRIAADKMEARRDSIVLAARSVFVAKGYVSAVVSDIAQAAGISDGLLYRYFGGKRELLMEVLEVFYNDIISGTENAIGKEPTFERKLTVLVQGHLQAFADDPDLCRLFISEVRTLDDYIGSTTQELNRRYTQILVDLIAWGCENDFISPASDPRLVRDFLFGGIEHLAWRQIGNGRTIDVANLTNQIVRLLMAGLKGDDAA
jgi:TetR/AcrR family fatty acid metabolism transcriptional regulator